MTQLSVFLFNGLKAEEDFRGFVYDDKTGKQISTGSVIEGNPTIGYGFAINKRPLTKKQCDFILQDFTQETETWCINNLKYWNDLSVQRQYAIANMVYQMGGEAWLGFVNANYYLSQKNYDSAYVEILHSQFAVETPARAKRMANILLNDSFTAI